MKNYLLTAVFGLTLIACKNESQTPKSTTIEQNVTENKTVPEQKPLELSQFESDLDPFQTGFVTLRKNKDAENVLLNFRMDNKTGNIVIDGNPVQIVSFENIGESKKLLFEGENLMILLTGFAEDEDAGGDCVYGNYKDMTVTYKGKTSMFHNIYAQFCPLLE